MSRSLNLRSLPRHRLLAIGAAALLFLSLYLPWFGVEVEWSDQYREAFSNLPDSESSNGWSGVGALAGTTAAALVAWEVLRVLKKAPRPGRIIESITALLAIVAATLGIIQVVNAFGYGGEILDSDAGNEFSAGASYGAWLGLIAALMLGYAAYLSFKASGGEALIERTKKLFNGNPAPQAEGATAPPPPPPAPRGGLTTPNPTPALPPVPPPPPLPPPVVTTTDEPDEDEQVDDRPHNA
ncbi:MAG TPA: hypothetical protein VIP77_25435 [Jiangellaceae bacterium]